MHSSCVDTPSQPDNEAKRWSAALEKKLHQLLVLLRSMKGADLTIEIFYAARPPFSVYPSIITIPSSLTSFIGKNEIRMAVASLNEVLPWLQVRPLLLIDVCCHSSSSALLLLCAKSTRTPQEEHHCHVSSISYLNLSAHHRLSISDRLFRAEHARFVIQRGPGPPPRSVAPSALHSGHCQYY